MAQRIAPLFTPGASLPARGHGARAMRLFATLLERERTRFTANPRLFLWQMCWSPIWVGSNGPAPRLGQRAEVPGWAAREEERSGADAFIHGNLGRLAFRFWISLLVGSILRGIWLALLVVTGWAVLALAGLVGLPSMLAIAGLTVLGAVAGAAYGFLHPIEPAIVAVMLDRTFGLDERLTTAIDRQAARVRDTASPTLPQLQLADAANILAEVMHELPRAVFFPVREAIALLVVTLALLTALFAHVPDRPLPGIAAAPVPRFVPASERLANPQVGDQPLATTPEEPAPSVSEVQQQAQAAQQAREDLGVLGEALDDHPITQGASDAIAAGDYPAASDMIRASAADAPNASPEEREALADDLDVAADQIAPTNPNLADSSREAAGDLRQGGSQAGDGLDGLADTVDQTAGVVDEDQAAPGEEASQEGNPGAAQPGAAGQESASSGDAQQGSESSQSSSGASNQSQQPAGDPGEGVAAEPGVANQELQEPNAGGDEAGEMSGASSSGQAQAGAGGAPDPEGAGGAPGSDQAGQEQPAANGASQGGSASDTESQGLQGAPDDETSASQGSGAGTGQSGANDQTRGSQEVGDPAAPGESEGAAPPSVDEAGDPPPGNGGGDGSAGEVGEVGGTNSLSLQGTSDEGVRTGGTSGSSSVGSGAGSGAASGDQVQQQVGVAGPDANRIPDGMQDIVQDFFTEPGTQP